MFRVRRNGMKGKRALKAKMKQRRPELNTKIMLRDMANTLSFVSNKIIQMIIKANKEFIQVIRSLSNEDRLPQEVRLAALEAGIIEQ
jgi:hypothetical protein